jgi:hypothetical protein
MEFHAVAREPELYSFLRNLCNRYWIFDIRFSIQSLYNTARIVASPELAAMRCGVVDR